MPIRAVPGLGSSGSIEPIQPIAHARRSRPADHDHGTANPRVGDDGVLVDISSARETTDEESADLEVQLWELAKIVCGELSERIRRLLKNVQ